MGELTATMVTRDPVLADAVRRLCAVAGVELETIEPAASEVTRCWRASTVLLLDESIAPSIGALGLPRRSSVVVLAESAAAADVWRAAVDVGAERVFTGDEDEALVDWLAGRAEVGRDECPVLACIGGRGGAGASTLAGLIACSAAGLGRRTTLVDADPRGGGLDLMLGVEDQPGLRWPDLTATRGVVSSDALAAALPRVGDLSLLTWGPAAAAPAQGSEPIPVAAMEALLPAARRASDLIVVDLPRQPDGAASCALQFSTFTFLVVPAEVRAVAAAAQLASCLDVARTELRLVVRAPGPDGLSAAEVERALGLPLVAEMPVDRGLGAWVERGEFVHAVRRGRLAGVATAVLDHTLKPRQEAS